MPSLNLSLNFVIIKKIDESGSSDNRCEPDDLDCQPHTLTAHQFTISHLHPSLSSIHHPLWEHNPIARMIDETISKILNMALLIFRNYFQHRRCTRPALSSSRYHACMAQISQEPNGIPTHCLPFRSHYLLEMGTTMGRYNLYPPPFPQYFQSDTICE